MPKHIQFRLQKSDEHGFGSASHSETPAEKLSLEMLRKNQKLIAMGRLSASIAHEINNPLESISNLLYLIGQEPVSDQVHTYLKAAEKELDRVIQISKQTLNFHRDTTTPVPMHIDQLIEEVLTLYRQRIDEKQLVLRRQYSSNEMVTVFPGEMRQVFSNLIANAIHASPKGGSLWLRIRTATRWADGTRGLRVIIGDNGSGMDANTRHRLGKPFLTTKGHSGTGLGLWVSMSILKRHGAQLQNYSSIDPKRHGTVFSIFLPLNMRPQMAMENHPLQEAG
ncbi:MAG TPA: HAMP domain-containing sensor histidine kinase [Alloacidobacterium sp.]|nr:HAMP domain-containing sensor histidine kinase [Alloacidobacterium sp.]